MALFCVHVFAFFLTFNDCVFSRLFVDEASHLGTISQTCVVTFRKSSVQLPITNKL